MPRYFFDLRDGAATIDDAGHECANLRDARKLATRFAGELLQHDSDRLWQDGDWTIWVRNEAGLQLFSVMVLSIVAPALWDRPDVCGAT